MARYRLSVSSVEVSCWMKIVFNSVASIDIKNALSVDQVFEGAIAEEIVKYDFSSRVRLIVLYKRDNDVIYYHEAIFDELHVTEHWGVVGERGQITIHLSHDKSRNELIGQILAPAKLDGFVEWNPNDYILISIKYVIQSHV